MFYLNDYGKQVGDCTERKSRELVSRAGQIDIKKDKGVYVGVEEDNAQAEAEDDGLGDIWKEMSFALESSKVFIFEKDMLKI